MDLSSINPILLLASLMVAATPILLAAIGELVVERAGVVCSANMMRAPKLTAPPRRRLARVRLHATALSMPMARRCCPAPRRPLPPLL